MTKNAIHHTLHCLVGCGTGEILGMLIASFFGWHRFFRVALAIIFSFICGYSLTYHGVRKQIGSRSEAIKATLVTDTISITSMELVDSIIEYLVPNALIVTAASLRFWWGLVLALFVAFIITVPINRYMMTRDLSNS